MSTRAELSRKFQAHDFAAVLFVSTIAQIAHWSGLALLLFPELGALAHCVITRPNHAWSKAPAALAVTPALAGLLGIIVMRSLGTGIWQVELVVGMSLAIVAILRSPILPALSAGALPLVLQVSQWTYPIALFLACSMLGAIAAIRNGHLELSIAAENPLTVTSNRKRDIARIGLFLLFLGGIAALAQVTTRPLLLFPPLAVLGFEILVRQNSHDWVRSPARLVLLFFVCGASGIIALHFLGDTSLAVAIAMTGALCAKYWLDLYVPPAIAVSIVPFAASTAGLAYPLEVSFSVVLLVALALLAQSIERFAVKTTATGTNTQVAKDTRTPARRNSIS